MKSESKEETDEEMDLDWIDASHASRSIVTSARKSRYRCPYCGKPDGSVAFTFWAFSIKARDLDALIRKGWCRSGNMVYFPLVSECCCPQYSMRIDVSRFKRTHSQKKTLKKMLKYLNNEYPLSESIGKTSLNHFQLQKIEFHNYIEEKLLSAFSRTLEESSFIQSALSSISIGDDCVLSEFNDNRIPAGQIVLVSKLAMYLFPSIPADTPKRPFSAFTFASMIVSNLSALRNAVSCRIEADGSILFSQTLENLDIFENTEESSRKVQRRHLKITLEKPSDTSEFYNLYYRYQSMIHHENLNNLGFRQFKEFIVDSPLSREPFPNQVGGFSCGSYHCCYRIVDEFEDGTLSQAKLIAYGVLDLLPTCVNSLYFVWDPDYAKLSLGTYSALQEIRVCQQLYAQDPSVSNYVIGYYIRNCFKMQYKLKYQPSSFYIDNMKSWVPFEQFKTIEDLIQKTEEHFKVSETVELSLWVFSRGVLMRYRKMLQDFPDLPELLMIPAYVNAVGDELATSMIYWII